MDLLSHNGRTTSKQSKATATARTRSSSARRRVLGEVQARKASQKEAWILQQELLEPGAKDNLMDAAINMLQPADYEAVVEERSLEGLCGYPPCSKDAVGQSTAKYLINAKDHECMSLKKIGMFCSRECLKKSGSWATHLAPDPHYVRPGSAIASSKAAVSDSQSRKNAPQVRTIPTPQKPVEPPREVAEKPQSNDSTVGDGKESSSPSAPKRDIPPIRKKAVVRFSRETKVYTVDCGDYDGGGSIPGEPTIVETPQGDDASCRRVTAKTCMRQMLSSPVVEKETRAVTTSSSDQHASETSQPAQSDAPTVAIQMEEIVHADVGKSKSPVTDIPSKTEQDSAEELGQPAQSDVPTIANQMEEIVHADVGKSKSPVTDIPSKTEQDSDEELGDVGEDDKGDGLFDAEAVFPGWKWSGSPFVRAWGILSSWLSDIAKDCISQGIRPPCIDDEIKPAHKGRRTLMMELLGSRVPGELSFLARRIYDVSLALGVHQALPSVSEVQLWDLLAMILLRHVFQSDVTREAISPNPYFERMLNHKATTAAKHAGVTESELDILCSLIPTAVASVDSLD